MKRYSIRRTGVPINVNTVNIKSDCHSIVFHNVADWPCYVKITDQPFRFYLDRGMTFSFGEERPNVMETNIFELEFDAVNVGTVKEVTVMRTDLIELSDNNNNNSERKCE
jgi:hypothetical protein